ncbi:MAG TPA: response regulator [Methanocorpusculum sp.]|nr:response regulator [Methanocorpusculum sp.]
MKKILVIDDASFFHTMANNALSKEYDVTCVSNAEEAYAWLNQAIPDLILLDIFMPDEDGLTFLHHIKNTPVWSRIPVIIATGDQNLETQDVGFYNSVADFITKPYSSYVLKTRVANVLELENLRSKSGGDSVPENKPAAHIFVRGTVYAYLLENTKTDIY